ncbi:MAG: hypothetical protein AAF740_01040, partial [Bacteroidota bacterium]
QQVDHVFANMNLDEVKSGLLYEFSLPLFDLVSIPKEEGINSIQWRGLYTSIMSAQVNENLRLLHLNSVKKRADSYREDGLIPVGIFDYELQRLKQDSSIQNLVVYQNGQLFDVSGNNNTPYETIRATAACPLQMTSSEGSVSYIFAKNLFFSAQELPDVLEVDFVDGSGFREVSWDTPVQVHYPEKGLKDLTFRLFMREILR